jgi:diguanylate cyclase (GGDEF)-like protein
VEWWCLLLFLCVALSWYVIDALTRYGETTEQEALVATVSAGATSFDPGVVATLAVAVAAQPPSEGEAANGYDRGKVEETAAFKEVRQRLQRLKHTITNSRFVYLMALQKGQIVFLADAEPPDSPDYSPPGQVYSEATDVLRGVFATKRPATEGPVADRWGNWVSGLAPLVNPANGEVVAILGVDIDATRWRARVAQFRWLGIVISGLVASIVLLFGIFSLRQRRAAMQLHHTARCDALTGIANRKVFLEAVVQAMARTKRNRNFLAVLYLDLDHFKDINDTLGHPVGDELLRQVAERLRSVVRETDLVARVGGDEFAILTEGLAEPVAAAKLAEKVVHVLSGPFFVAGNTIASGTSVGIAVWGPDETGIDPDLLLSRADIALYQAKSEGRGGYCFFTERMETEFRERVALLAELRQAAPEDQYFLAYQPQVDLKTGRITGVEALIRWRHPQRGVLTPAEFIRTAEQSGLVLSIDRWALREACRQAKEWLDAGLAFDVISVNISALHVKRAVELEKEILRSLAETGLPPQKLELELVESGMAAASDRCENVLSRLRQHGIRLAIDNFGLGYSSLHQLRGRPADRVKISRIFVGQIDSEPSSASIVKAIVSVSRELGMVAIAEGVERPEQIATLCTCFCPQAQGSFFAEPLSPTGILPLLQRGTIEPSLNWNVGALWGGGLLSRAKAELHREAM